MRTQPARTGGYRTLALAVGAVLALAAHAEAQTATSFDELPGMLNRGELFTVVDNGGDRHVGRIIDVSPSALSLLVLGVRHDLPAADVSSIHQRRPDPLRNGVLKGLSVAAIPAFLVSGAMYGHAYNEGGSFQPATGMLILSLGLGAALGAGLDALVADSVVIYDRSRATRQRLTVSPLVSAHRQGVAVSLGF